MSINLSQLVPTLNLHPQPSERWAILGPEANAFRLKLNGSSSEDLDPSNPIKTETGGQQSMTGIFTADSASAWGNPSLLARLDGLILAGALSAETEVTAWLKQLTASLSEGATLVAIDWQGDGPLDVGPDLAVRFKRGQLFRQLRQEGFGLIELLVNHPIYYIIRAMKKPPAPVPHAGEFVAVAELAELPKNGMKQVELFGYKLVVANTGKEIVAFAQTCPHAGSSLAKGMLRGCHIICPLHFYIWNVCTGEPVEPADEDILSLYPVKIDHELGQVLVALA